MTIEKENQFNDNLLLFVRIGVGILSVLFLAIIISRIVYPFDTGFVDAFNWMPAAHLSEGKNPYAYAFTPPYSMTPYGIVFYSLLAVGVKLFGFQLWWGKLLSVLALTGCLWAIFNITKRLTENNKEAALFSCLVGLAMFPMQSTIAVIRSSDMIAAAFSLTAFLFTLSLAEDKKTKVWRIFGIALLLCAAFFTKQTALLPIVFISLRFLQTGKWREAALIVSIFAILTAGGIYLLNYTSSGGYLWQHFTHARRLPYSFGDSVRFFIIMLKTPAFFFFGVFLVFFGYRKREIFYKFNRDKLLRVLRSPKSLILLYLAFSLGWAFLSAGRIGANVNYYTESSFVAAIVCGLIYADFKRNALPRWALAMIALFTLGGAFQQARILRGEYFRWESLSYYREMFETVGKLTPPGSLCVSALPEFVVWNGCAFHFDDYSEYREGWSPELREIFEREIKAGNYAVIIWDNDNLQSKFPNYRLVPMSRKKPEKYFTNYLYVPEKSPSK
jgi:Dolichyl-phosphate-mannose-protein mannosyltransferase